MDIKELSSMVYTVFDKNFASGGGVKKEKMSNQESAK